MSDLYENDFYGWSRYQAEVLKNREIDKIDWENIIEEIESLGRNEKHRLFSNLKKIYVHLLKWIYQPERRSREWKNYIETHRDNFWQILNGNPTLNHNLSKHVNYAYFYARKEAARQTGINIRLLPEMMPFSYENSVQEEWFPE